MFSKLMPKEGKFFDLFNAHADLIVKGGQQLATLVADMTSGVGKVPDHHRAIDDLERQADRITHDTIALLHTSFNTPLSREEIHQLISNMDNILDLIQDVAESMHLYDVRKLTDEARELSAICVNCCALVKVAVSHLSNMDRAAETLKICREIDELESQADTVMRNGIIKLFREEEDVRELIKLKGIYELLETVTDRCEDVANIIEGIVLENA